MPDLIGIDIGGTFTDFVFLSEGQIRILKLPTNRVEPGACISEGLDRLGETDTAQVIHGTTVATNALLERKGARTALVTTSGFEDVIELARQQRPHLYRFSQNAPESLVPPSLRFGVRERIGADGEILQELKDEEIESLAEALARADVDSVAIVLLFSFVHPGHEQALAEIIRARLPDVDISVSSHLIPEYREFERTSTTVANAYLNPIVRKYLSDVARSLGSRTAMIMHSGAGVSDIETASSEAARLVLSGPAGGVIGAFDMVRNSGTHEPIRIITLDMGGTSTDVCLCDGAIPVTSTSVVGNIPLRFPAVDIQTVGAGGGSVAWIDDAGVLRVGPQSAGADPGPVCYGRGGEEPTVTDANLVLGRLSPDRKLGGDESLTLDLVSAEDSVGKLADKLGLALHEAALGIVRVANATMERALRRVSIAQGYDPRNFTLVPFGGAGPLHACALASALSIEHILIPQYPGVLSALGLCRADISFDRAVSILARIEDLVTDDSVLREKGAQLKRAIESHFSSLNQKGTIGWSADVRYVGQSYELTIDLDPPEQAHVLPELAVAFHEEHRRRFSYALEHVDVELVTLRAKGVITRAARPDTSRASLENSAPTRDEKSSVWFESEGYLEIDIFNRDSIRIDELYEGPTIIYQPDTTILIEPGWFYSLKADGTLHCNFRKRNSDS